MTNKQRKRDYVIYVHTDGSSQYKYNSWIGAYAFTIEYNNQTIYQKCCNLLPATNNLCELMAVINGVVKILSDYDIEKTGTILILTDSEYVINGVTGKTKIKTNKPAWAYLNDLLSRYDIQVKHVASHVEGGNKHVDGLAKNKMRQYVVEHEVI